MRCLVGKNVKTLLVQHATQDNLSEGPFPVTAVVKNQPLTFGQVIRR